MDDKSPPWTDGKGKQKKFRTAAEHLEEYMDSLPDSNEKWVPEAQQVIVLEIKRHGQAAELRAETT